MKKAKLGTAKLNNGMTVSAREVKGEMYSYHFVNRTQATAHAEKVGGEIRQFGPVFYVRVDPS